MAVMTQPEWSATKVPGRKVRICYGELCDTLDAEDANSFALGILGATGYNGPLPGAGEVTAKRNASKTATAKKGGGKKGGMKGGKGC